jgi:predicted  nucleic acid-binding Zn-ribbon protein
VNVLDSELEHRLTTVEDRSKSNQHRLDEMEKRQDDQEKLISTVAVLANEQKTIQTDVQEIKSDVKSLTSKPGKRWDNLVNQIIAIVVAAVAGFILAKIGL